MDDSRQSIGADFNQKADQCVLCGICLAHCPTYLKTYEEGESPRGRIALLIALARKELTPSARIRHHVDHCLVCRACERVCPAEVPYGQIIDAGRAHLTESASRYDLKRQAAQILLNQVISQPQRIHTAGWILYLLQQSGLLEMASFMGLGHLTALLPPEIPPLHPFRRRYPPQGTPRGQVALFVGCVTGILDRLTLDAAIAVLTRLGYRVDVPSGQVCCGALHLHHGDRDGAQRLIERNLAAFNSPEWDAIVTVASGCGATLSEYPNEKFLPFAKRIMDISDFLTRRSWPAEIKIRPLPKRVAIHDPCTLTNVLNCPQAPYTLLRNIPDLMVLGLPGNSTCCGAAGAAMLTKSPLHDSLRADKIAALRAIAPDILATSNIGCALFLAQGVRQAGLNIEVLHPITLIARQLL